MNNKKTEELLNYLLESLRQGIELTKNELPLVAKEILVFDAWEASIWIYGPIISIFVCTVGVPFFLFALKTKAANRYDGVAMVLTFSIGVLVFTMLISIILMPIKGYHSYVTMKQIETAPKYYLLNKVIKK